MVTCKYLNKEYMGLYNYQNNSGNYCNMFVMVTDSYLNIETKFCTCDNSYFKIIPVHCKQRLDACD